MQKLRCLLLDANIIIKLFELGLWERVIERCELVVAETVVEEAQYFEDDETHQKIDLTPDLAANRVFLISMTATDMGSFFDRFSPDYLDQIDPGEAESLAFLLSSRDPCLLCSADAIVFRVLGRFNLGEQGISLEEIMQKIGPKAAIPNHYNRSFRESWTKVSQQDMIRGTGLKH